jgi:serine/threonine protein kinase
MKGCHNKKMKNLKATLNQALGGGPWETNHNGEGELLDGIRFRPVGDSTLRAFGAEEDSLTSGSGSGMPQLVQRTLARQIHLGELIGKGRYGKVHKGTWNGDNYAVKIFLTKDEDSWKRETDIYSTVLLRHENILGYVGSDVTSLNSCTQLWLVTDYYHNGSLYDFLRDTSRPCLTTCQAYGILASCLSGLVHLHQEIFGTKTQDQHNYKPAIAHRDIKSKNILVREDGFTCVIADFGLAVTYNSSEGDMDVMHNYRVGTKRYMSPEILDGSIENNKTFESYKRADVYALALVMWEVLKRTQIHTSGVDEESNLQILGTDQPLFSRESNDYALPYHLDVAPDPTFDEMKKVVRLDKKRPNLPLHWTSGKNSFFAGLTNIMKECWHEKPDVRHSMLRIKKNLNELQRYAIELDTHEIGSSSCYFSLYGPHRPNRTSSCNVSPHRNEDSAIGYNMNPRRAQYDTYNENQPAIARGLGFSRHSITGGGGSRAVGDSGGTAGSGSVNSTITQTSYCSSGYQSKLGSQSGSVDQSGIAGNDGSAIFTPEYQRILPTSTNATHSHVHRNESQESTIALGTIAQVSNSINSQLSRTGAAHIPQFRNVVSRSQIHGPPIQDPMLDENEEDGTQS